MKTMILIALAALATAAPAAARQDGRLTVVFDADSDALTTEAVARIAAFARDHRNANADSVRVEGHATLAESWQQSADYAVGLAQRRADNVRSALVGAGLPQRSIVTATFGAGRPLANAPAASARNRRVEIFIAEDTGW